MIAYFGALKVGAKVTPISPVYTSKEVKHQLEDSDAKTVVCQDILYDNVEKTGIKLDQVILTSIGEYLPALKNVVHGKEGARPKLYQEMQVPTPKHIKEAGLLSFQDLIQKSAPASPPSSPLTSARTSRSCPTPAAPRVFPRRPC